MRPTTTTSFRQGNVIQTLVLFAAGCGGAIWIALTVGGAIAHGLARVSALFPS